jgi:hypothetical protein
MANNIITNLGMEILKKAIKKAAGLTDDNINLTQALGQSLERSVMYELHDIRKEKELEEQGIKPNQCYNAPCKYQVEKDGWGDECSGKIGRPVSCLYRMTSLPPNVLDYSDKYMPSHKEALDMLAEHGLVKDGREEYIKASIYYGKAESRSERDNTEIKGITMAQARLAISDTIKQYLDYAVENSWITQECREEIDEGVIASNCAVELEKVMGIFPNIRILY